MKLSSKTHYGLMASIMLGKVYPDGTISASELEKGIGVSGKYLEKIMRLLGSRSIVSANRGANGGYYLLKDPKDITIGEIVRALEDDMKIIECVDKNGTCKCCPSQRVWKKLYTGINDVLDSMTLSQVLNGEL